MSNATELDFYAAAGPMTDLSRCPAHILAGLPSAPDEVAKVVRRLVSAGPAPDGRNDGQIRPAVEMIDRIQELHPAPLVEPRPPADRFIGTCRHFATLTCALLRHQGTPVRVRAGFAGYFEPDAWLDHWVIEYWSHREERWVGTDPQYGDRFFQAFDPQATSEAVVRDRFLSGGQTWLACRRGELDPDRCKMGGVNSGIGEVRGSVMYDFAALNQDEMLPWDVWGQMKAAYDSETDTAYDDLLDEISTATSSGDFDAFTALYRSDLSVPPSLLPAAH